ncbi:glucosamine-6-phosphate deaminase [Clostridium thermarum]|uniref:glucosamine-6-phosphate deaminase n=1 Tax=Clostridium thermarum TaxID=1716543 RepID=UPI0013CFCAA9|nr:glucosamine-6-phosphate deaminase [Clostridium thermarum]
MKVIIAKNYAEMSKAAADIIRDLVNSKPNTVLGLATGSTPIGMYKQLIEYYREKSVDFSQVATFNLDEYLGLPGTHPQSYRYFMDNNFFNHINIKKHNTHVPSGIAQDIEAECLSYDKAIAEEGGIDLQVLGIGNNGHIGFNEPSDTLHVNTHVTRLKQDTIMANSRFFNSIEEVPTSAVTMGIGGIMKARQILLLASGPAKAEIISKLVNGKINTHIPASLIQVHPNVTVIIDEEAASLLLKKTNQIDCPLSWAE